MERYINKIREKGITGLFKSLKMRIYYSVILPWNSMHSNLARKFWRLFQILPINKRLIIFESEPDFCDNSWALYQYLKKERPKYRFVWIVQNRKNFGKFVDNQTSFATRYGDGMHLKTIYYYATAKYNFYTHWTYQPYIPRKGQTVVNLWHGGYPLKASKAKNRDYYDWLVSMGEEGKDALARYLGCGTEKICAIGQPRIDLLVANIGDGVKNPFVHQTCIKKVILWMPTFRSSANKNLSEQLCDTETGLPLLQNQYDIIEFNEWLKERRVVFITKIHHLQAKKEIFKTSYSNFIILTDDVLALKGFQLYEIVGKTDALLTDYSTIVWDYIVVDKPIGFILDDIKLYEDSCGFNVSNVKSLLKGEHIYNKGQLQQFVLNVLDGKDEYKIKRKKLLEQKIQMFPKGGNCKNIVNYFGI